MSNPASLVPLVPPQLSFETLCYSATETRKLIDLAGDTSSVNCLPSEIVLVCRHATGAITRWRLRLMDINGVVTFTGLEVCAVCGRPCDLLQPPHWAFRVRCANHYI